MKGLIIKVQYFIVVKKYIDGNYFYEAHIALLISVTRLKLFREANHGNLTILPESYAFFSEWRLLPGEEIN